MTLIISTFNLYKGGSLVLYSAIKNILNKTEFAFELSFGRKLDLQHKSLSVPYPSKKLNIIYRLLLEQLILPFFCLKKKAKHLVTMGNFPCLLWFGPQTVFFHNVLYLQPLKKRSLTSKIEAIFFKISLIIKKPRICVQTQNIKDLFQSSFKKYHFMTEVIGTAYNPIKRFHKKVYLRKNNPQVILFYPAFYYPHKNHSFLMGANSYFKALNIHIYLTISRESVFCDEEDFSQFKLLGNLSKSEIKSYYQKAHGLIFPSQSESLGYPLIEAVNYSMPIIAPNLPYVNALVKNFYKYNSASLRSLQYVIHKFKSDLLSGNVLTAKTIINTCSTSFIKKLTKV